MKNYLNIVKKRAWCFASINMGLLFLVAIIITLCWYGTSNDTYESNTYVQDRDIKDNMKLIEIDGCEYFYLRSYGRNSPGLCHKGNCKNPIHH